MISFFRHFPSVVPVPASRSRFRSRFPRILLTPIQSVYPTQLLQKIWCLYHKVNNFIKICCLAALLMRAGHSPLSKYYELLLQVSYISTIMYKAVYIMYLLNYRLYGWFLWVLLKIQWHLAICTCTQMWIMPLPHVWKPPTVIHLCAQTICTCITFRNGNHTFIAWVLLEHLLNVAMYCRIQGWTYISWQWSFTFKQ